MEVVRVNHGNEGDRVATILLSKELKQADLLTEKPHLLSNIPAQIDESLMERIEYIYRKTALFTAENPRTDERTEYKELVLEFCSRYEVPNSMEGLRKMVISDDISQVIQYLSQINALAMQKWAGADGARARAQPRSDAEKASNRLMYQAMDNSTKELFKQRMKWIAGDAGALNTAVNAPERINGNTVHYLMLAAYLINKHGQAKCNQLWVTASLMRSKKNKAILSGSDAERRLNDFYRAHLAVKPEDLGNPLMVPAWVLTRKKLITALALTTTGMQVSGIEDILAVSPDNCKSALNALVRCALSCSASLDFHFSLSRFIYSLLQPHFGCFIASRQRIEHIPIKSGNVGDGTWTWSVYEREFYIDLPFQNQTPLKPHPSLLGSKPRKPMNFPSRPSDSRSEVDESI